MPVIQLEVHDGNTPIIIDIPSDADFARFQNFLSGYGQFREDASRFIFNLQDKHRDYLEVCKREGIDPLPFIQYLSHVRQMTDDEMLRKYRQDEAIKESMQKPDTGVFGMVKAKPAELSTGPAAPGTCANGDQCGCFWDQGAPKNCVNYREQT